MTTNETEIADFYRQLSLLVKSNLPLPESIYQLASNFDKPDFKKVLFSVSEGTSKGQPLSEVMKQFPDYFRPFHVKMIGCGEKSGTLSEILNEIAYISRMNYQLVSMVKGFALYPIFAISFTLVLFSLILRFIVPGFSRIFNELLGGTRLPPITQLVTYLSSLTVRYEIVMLAIFFASIVFLIWLFGKGITAQKTFYKIISFLPLSVNIFKNLQMSRFCSMWAVFMEQKLPMVYTFEAISEIIEDDRLSVSLKNISKGCAEGRDLAECLRNEKIISDLIILTVKNVPENRRSEELKNLAQMYKERTIVAINKAGVLWDMALIISLSVVVGIIIIGLFSPLIAIIKSLGG
ncbi:MAG: type II secretion system F family protein [Lentisphaerota bacterium]